MSHAALIIAVAGAVTLLLRFLPFLIFGGKRETPPYIVYLGKVLPYAIMGMLVIYCLRGISFTAAANFLPELAINVVFSPAGQRILHAVQKQ